MQFPLLSLPSETLKGRRPRHPGFLQPGSVPRVHRVSPIHVPRVKVSLGVRKASLSHSLVLAHYQRVVERRERRLVLLPPQMFGRLCTHAGSAAGDQRCRPHFPAGRVHPPRHVDYYFFCFLKKCTLCEHSNGMTRERWWEGVDEDCEFRCFWKNYLTLEATETTFFLGDSGCFTSSLFFLAHAKSLIPWTFSLMPCTQWTDPKIHPFTHHEVELFNCGLDGGRNSLSVQLGFQVLPAFSTHAHSCKVPVLLRHCEVASSYRTVQTVVSLQYANFYKPAWLSWRTGCVKPHRHDNTVLPFSSALREQAATGYREQDNTLNMRDPPKAPPLKSEMQEVGVGREPGGQITQWHWYSFMTQ